MKVTDDGGGYAGGGGSSSKFNGSAGTSAVSSSSTPLKDMLYHAAEHDVSENSPLVRKCLEFLAEDPDRVRRKAAEAEEGMNRWPQDQQLEFMSAIMKEYPDALLWKRFGKPVLYALAKHSHENRTGEAFLLNLIQNKEKYASQIEKMVQDTESDKRGGNVFHHFINRVAQCDLNHISSLRIVSAYIQLGADINHRDDFGMTPLDMLAATLTGDDKRLYTLMVNAGADYNMMSEPDFQSAQQKRLNSQRAVEKTPFRQKVSVPKKPQV